MEITLKKINNEVVTPLKIKGGSDKRPVRGNKIFPEVYSNIFICARKKSGKTVVIQKILKECCGKHTTILAFSSTVNKDANWIAIRSWAKKHKIPFEGFPSMKEHKIDFLEKFIHRLEDEGEEEQLGGSDHEAEDSENESSSSSSSSRMGLDMFGGKRAPDIGSEEDSADEDEDMFEGYGKAEREQAMAEKRLFDKKAQTSVKDRDPYQSPEFILIFDDLSNELKFPSLVSLLKKNRHFKLKIIISSQYLNDLKPESIRQLDYVLLFKGQTDDKLIKVLTACDLAIDFPTLKAIYDDAVKEPFGFLYISVREDQFRKNFDKMYSITKGTI